MGQLLPEPATRLAFGRLGGRTLIARDGPNISAARDRLPAIGSRNAIRPGSQWLAATVVAPGPSKVVPLGFEFIAKQDGAEKQDCERNAVIRWHEKHGARLKPLRPTYPADDHFACQSVVKMLEDGGDDFILTCKETPHKALYDFIDGRRARAP